MVEMIEVVEASEGGGQEFPKIGVRSEERKVGWMDGRLPFVRTKVIGNVIKIGEIARGGGAVLLSLSVCLRRGGQKNFRFRFDGERKKEKKNRAT